MVSYPETSIGQTRLEVHVLESTRFQCISFPTPGTRENDGKEEETRREIGKSPVEVQHYLWFNFVSNTLTNIIMP